MKRALLLLSLSLLLVAAGPATAATDWDHASWGWSRPAGPHVDFRWGEPFEPVELNDRWTVQPCGGDAPFVCFDARGPADGKAELVTFPIDREGRISRDREEGGRAYALRRHARRHHRTFDEDRSDCAEGYTFHPLRIRDATVAGRDGIRFGFVVRDGDGRVVERSNSFATLTRTQLVIVGAEGLNDRACLPIEGPTFTPNQLRGIGPNLARVVADGRLPR